MTPSALLDANVILRHILHDHETHSLRASALFLRIKSGELSVHIPDTVIFETVFTLEKFYRVSRDEIRNAILGFLTWPAIILPGKDLYGEVFDRWIREPSLSFADSYHLSLAKSLGISEIISFDRKLNREPDVKLVEP